MPTINSIVRQASMVASLSTKFFGSDFEAGRNSLLVGPSFGTLNNQVKSDFGGQPALTNMVENYQARRDAFSKELNDNMQSLKDSSEKLKESTGTEESTTQTAEATTDTDNDQNTGSTLSNLSGFASGNIPPQNRTAVAATNETTQIPPPPPDEENQPAEELTDEEIREAMRNNFQEAMRMGFDEFTERYLVAETAEDDDLTALEEVNQQVQNTENAPNQRASTEDIINNVRNLVRDYNSARNYINENRGLSSQMSALADTFGTNRDLAESLTSIGIFMDSNGELSVNEAILSMELERDADNVSSILGSEGLAGQMERDVERVENASTSQSNNLFPTIDNYTNNNTQDITESLYSRQNFNAASYAWENISRFFTMLT